MHRRWLQGGAAANGAKDGLPLAATKTDTTVDVALSESKSPTAHYSTTPRRRREGDEG
eukprot:CAMPEP_0197464000 /NCGR_PEP_ID=MMETSP1175-20131217/63326_1 /TAXON_ID=1003142 /ORGANISM="Triceratium dubium, Strain CCMP147" /LENGTH=57 /DNA_ID=CAMNT_0042999897 /DNA_START=1 /DNA_END=171 /DNA_ORIENTATION=-